MTMKSFSASTATSMPILFLYPAAAWRKARESADDAWMVAWAPAERGRVVTCFLVEGGGSGGAVAGPIAIERIQGGLEVLRAEP